MRIAFDLDDTLIPCRYHFPTESPFPVSLFRRLFPEQLREGSQTFLHTLRKQGYDIWIYTTSQRSSWFLKLWFWVLGIHLGGIVNLKRHTHVMKAFPAPLCHASKYPPAFHIDILVDNSEGVLLEGQQYHFSVIQITPDDLMWEHTIQTILYNIRKTNSL